MLNFHWWFLIENVVLVFRFRFLVWNAFSHGLTWTMLELIFLFSSLTIEHFWGCIITLTPLILEFDERNKEFFFGNFLVYLNSGKENVRPSLISFDFIFDIVEDDGPSWGPEVIVLEGSCDVGAFVRCFWDEWWWIRNQVDQFISHWFRCLSKWSCLEFKTVLRTHRLQYSLWEWDVSSLSFF